MGYDSLGNDTIRVSGLFTKNIVCGQCGETWGSHSGFDCPLGYIEEEYTFVPSLLTHPSTTSCAYPGNKMCFSCKREFMDHKNLRCPGNHPHTYKAIFQPFPQTTVCVNCGCEKDGHVGYRCPDGGMFSLGSLVEVQLQHLWRLRRDRYGQAKIVGRAQKTYTNECPCGIHPNQCIYHKP